MERAFAICIWLMFLGMFELTWRTKNGDTIKLTGWVDWLFKEENE